MGEAVTPFRRLLGRVSALWPERLAFAAWAPLPLQSVAARLRLAGGRVLATGVVHLSFATWLALAVQTVFLVLSLFLNPWRLTLGKSLGYLAVNYLVTITWFQVVGLTFRTSPVPLRIANLFSLWAMAILFCWHFCTTEPLDFAMPATNFHELFYRASIETIVRQSGWLFVVGLTVVVPGGLVAISVWTKWLARWPRPTWPWSTLLGSIAVLAAISATPAAFYNELTSFGRSAINYYCQSIYVQISPGYPYVHDGVNESANLRPSARPHVFVILVESFNARFVDRWENGREITPFFNQLRHKGLYVEHFYGNSMQTGRGHEAVLLGIPPSYNLPQALQDPPRHLRSLPAILNDAGYQTCFFQGHNDITFDNTGPFMEYIGFETVISMGAPEQVKPEDHAFIDYSYWGMEDSRLYQKGLRFLDERHDAQAAGPGGEKPCFVTFATITSHMMWDRLPADRKFVWPQTTGDDYAKNFANAICLADRGLAVFFEELNNRPWLKDSIVVITGDHSYPSGEHDGSFRNQVGFYEDNFHIPLLIVGPGVQPRWVKSPAYSQLDIAPTLLDLLGVYVKNHFVGRTMLHEDAEQGPIPLAQPYTRHLVIVRWPIKYVYHILDGAELVYNVSKDPGETTDLRAEYEAAAKEYTATLTGPGVTTDPVVQRQGKLLLQFRRDVREFQTNQKLIENDRIWPE